MQQHHAPAPDTADILRHAAQLGWTLTETRAGEIASAAAPAHARLAQAARRLGFDGDPGDFQAALLQLQAPPPAAGQGSTPPADRAPSGDRPASLTEAAAALRSGTQSAEALTRAALARIEALNPRLNAFVRIDEAAVLAAARARDADQARGLLVGPLHGVPLAHKDMFYRQGQVSRCGSRIRADWVAPETASVLQRLDEAGALQVGTLHMTEFAYGPTGQNGYLGDARNPWHPERITGGSSSGSAVAVATGMVFGALGSDTAGSVRLPAAMCGVVGMKTTYGRVSRAGAMPLSHSLDTVGPLTRTVADNALLLSVMAGQDPRDASTPPVAVPDYRALLDGPVQGLRVGLPRGYFDRDLHPDVAQRLHAMAAQCRDLGMQLVDIDMPDLDEVNAVGFLLTWGDVIGIHGTWMRERAADYTPQVQGRILTTLAATLPGYLAAQRLRGPMLREFDDRVFGRCDLLLAPVLPFPVPRLSDVDTSGGASTIRILNEITRLMRPINVLGLPALSLPGGATPDGLPCGLQLIGRPYAEALLYRVGHALEQALGGFASPGPGAHSG